MRPAPRRAPQRQFPYPPADSITFLRQRRPPLQRLDEVGSFGQRLAGCVTKAEEYSRSRIRNFCTAFGIDDETMQVLLGAPHRVGENVLAGGPLFGVRDATAVVRARLKRARSRLGVRGYEAYVKHEKIR